MLGLLMLVREFPDDWQTALIVGHNPGMAELTVGLTAPPPDPPSAFPTAAIAVLGLPGGWADAGPGEARLLAFAVPADMRLPRQHGPDLAGDLLVLAGGDHEGADPRAVGADVAVVGGHSPRCATRRRGRRGSRGRPRRGCGSPAEFSPTPPVNTRRRARPWRPPSPRSTRAAGAGRRRGRAPHADRRPPPGTAPRACRRCPPARPGRTGTPGRLAELARTACRACSSSHSTRPGSTDPGPGRHHQALQRREPHGGVHRAAAESTAASDAPGAQVAGDDPQPVRRVRRRAEQFRHPPRGVGVGQAVEPVPAQCPPGAPLRGQRERGRRVRDGRVERGVEAGHRGRAGQHGGHRVERGERLGLVQRREVGERLDAPPHLSVDEHRRGVQRPAVHHPVPDRVHPAERLDRLPDRRRCRRPRAARAGRRRPSPRRQATGRAA